MNALAAVATLALAGASSVLAAPADLATSFEENLGQFPPEVRFVHRSRDFEARVLVDGSLQLAAPGWTRTLGFEPYGGVASDRSVGFEERRGRAHVLAGAGGVGSITGIPRYGGVLVREVNPGVDLELTADGERLALDFRFGPGSDPPAVRVRLDGADHLLNGDDIDSDFGTGTLHLRSARHAAAPSASIEVVLAPSPCSAGDSDPVRIAVADDGVLVAGTVDRGRGVGDAFVAKLTSDRTSLDWVAYLGLDRTARVASIAAAPDGGVSVQGTLGETGDAFEARLASDGTSVSVSWSPGPRAPQSPAPSEARLAGRTRAIDHLGGVASTRVGSLLVAGSRHGGGMIGVVGPIGTSGDAVVIAAAGCPGTIQFDDSAGTGEWSTATNWSTDLLPGPSDDACIGPGFSVTLTAGAQAVGTVFVDAGSSLTLTGGSLTIAGSSRIEGPLTLESGGTLAGTGDVTVSGPFTWTGGTATGAATIFADGGLSIGTAVVKDLTGGRILEATGQTTWNGSGMVRVGSGAAIRNRGLWDAQTDATLSVLSGAASFENAVGATFRKSAGTGTTTVSVPFTNSGAVEVQSGTLSFGGSGTHTGSFIGTAGTTLRFSGGTHSLPLGSSIAASAVTFAGATATVGGSWNVSSGSTFSSGTVTFEPSSTLTSVGSSLTVSGGTATFDSGETIAPATLTLSSGALQGSDDVTVSGLTTWTGGAMSGAGTTSTVGGMSIGGGGLKDVTGGRVLETGGTTTWSGAGTVRIGTGATIRNLGSWDVQGDASLAVLSGAASFDNPVGAVFRKSAGTGTTTVSVPFTNSGSVDLESGTLIFSGSGTHTGSFAGAPGTTLRFNGGTQSLMTASSVTADTVSFGGATATVSGNWNVTSGTTITSGSATFDPSSILTSIGSSLTVSGGTATFNSGETIAPATLTLSSGTLQGTDPVTVSGLTTWSGGAMSGAATTSALGGMSIGGGTVKDVTGGRILETGGTTTWSGTGAVRIGTGGVIRNLGLWNAQSDAFLSALSGASSFENPVGATFRKSAGTGSTIVLVPFTNSGTVEIGNGNLAFNGSATHAGAFAGASGTSLQFNGGTQTLTSTSSVAADAVAIGGATVTVDGTWNVTSGTSVSIGSIHFEPASIVTSIGSSLTVSGGTATFNSGDAIAPATLSLSGGTLQGTDAVTVSGLTTWNSGAMSGAATTSALGGVSLSGAGIKDLIGGRLLETSGTTTWSGSGSVRIGSGAVVRNLGLWNLQGDASLVALSGSSSFENRLGATFRKSAGSGSTTLSVPFTNSGSVDLQSGTLILNGSATHSGSFAGAAGTSLQFNGGTQTLSSTSSVAANAVAIGGATVTVDGTWTVTSGTTVSIGSVLFEPASTVTSIGSSLTVTGGTATFDSGESLAPATLNLSGGTLQGSDPLTVSGTATWTDGTMSGAGTTSALGGISFSGGGIKDLLGGRLLETGGTTLWTGSGQIRIGTGASIRNLGVWDAQGDSSLAALSGAGGFDNTASGTLRKSSGSGTTTVAVPFTTSGAVEALSGTLSFANGYPQTAGSTTLNGGVIASPSPLDIQAGLLQGFGTVAAGATSAGLTRPGSSLGILGLSGNYVQTSEGSFAVEIGGLSAGTEHDRLDVAGNATLAGGLEVSLVNGFVPAAGDEFTILTCASRTGTFATTQFPALPAGLNWRVDYFPAAVKLAVFFTPAGRVPGDLPSESRMTAAKSGTDLTIDWSGTCVPSDTDYAVYEGTLGNFASHVPVICSTGGATSATFTPAAGSRYYLVTAHNGYEEGSYGYGPAGAERAQSASACHPQNIATCP